jgi:hypothetical protein
MKIARLKNITFLRGIIRVYLVLWVLWTLFLVASYHREVFTASGSDYWSREKIYFRGRELCKKCGDQSQGLFEVCPSSDDCEVLKYSVPVGINKEDARQTGIDLIYLTLILPAAFGIFGMIIVFLVRWALAGFWK